MANVDFVERERLGAAIIKAANQLGYDFKRDGEGECVSYRIMDNQGAWLGSFTIDVSIGLPAAMMASYEIAPMPRPGHDKEFWEFQDHVFKLLRLRVTRFEAAQKAGILTSAGGVEEKAAGGAGMGDVLRAHFPDWDSDPEATERQLEVRQEFKPLDLDIEAYKRMKAKIEQWNLREGLGMFNDNNDIVGGTGWQAGNSLIILLAERDGPPTLNLLPNEEPANELAIQTFNRLRKLMAADDAGMDGEAGGISEQNATPKKGDGTDGRGQTQTAELTPEEWMLIKDVAPYPNLNIINLWRKGYDKNEIARRCGNYEPDSITTLISRYRKAVKDAYGDEQGLQLIPLDTDRKTRLGH